MTRVHLCGLVLAVAAFFCVPASAQPVGEAHFEQTTLAAVGPRAPWGKAVADINGDGLDDVIVAGHQPRHFRLAERLRNKLGLEDLARQIGALIWYEAPTWTAHVVANDQAFRTDVAAADLNGDGALDLVALADSGVWLYTAPNWQAQRIASGKYHDIDVADLAGNGQLSIVLRNQSLFGHNDGNRLTLLTATSAAQTWSPRTVEVPAGEGLVVTDINGDGLIDLVVNQQLLLNDGQGDWVRVAYAPDGWPDAALAVADYNGDGRLDIASAPAEARGQRASLVWYEAPPDGTAPWREHVVLADIEAVHHALVAADFDRDGHVDLATAAMNQGSDPDEVLVLRNRGRGEAFDAAVVGLDGSHNLQTLDADGDFDIDIVGTNWERHGFDGDYPVTLWRNGLPPRAWRRFQIDAKRPGTATHVLAGDLDGDGLNDLVTGGYAYTNPGRLDGRWVRQRLGSGANNAVALHDADADGDLDVLANGWSGYGKPTLAARVLAKLGVADDPWAAQRNSLALATNNSGAFDATTVVDEMPHDWVHGAVVDARDALLYLSMHAADSPLYRVTLPGVDGQAPWRLETLSGASQNEALSLADLTGDGHPEVVTGTGWHSLTGQGPVRFFKSDLPVDRHRVGDIDGDGRLDVIAGYESADRAANVAWYARDDDTEQWTEHVIGRLAGPMSLDVGDVDLDGDLDVVVGEHRPARPALARLVLYENRGGTPPQFRAHRVGVGDEHHDGALLADLDADGDLDLASIGWTHGRVLVYENPTVQ